LGPPFGLVHGDSGRLVDHQHQAVAVKHAGLHFVRVGCGVSMIERVTFPTEALLSFTA
jgi:hypothetical protein